MTALRDAIDYTTLGWVKPELDETLRQARIEIEGFAGDPLDTSRMRFCASYLHQVQGTLRMVELYAPAMVAEEMEQLAQALQNGEVGDRDGACATLMRGAVLLPDYLERLQSGHKDIPIVLMPLLNELRAARGEPGLSESVLFAPDLARPLPAALPTASVQHGPARHAEVLPLVERLSAAIADWPEQGAPADAGELDAAIEALLARTDQEETRRMLWVAGSVATALGDAALPTSAGLRQVFVSVLRETRRQFEDDGFGIPRPETALEPTRQLLYHVAHSDAQHPALQALRDTFDLDAQLPSDSEISHAQGSLSGRNRALLDTVAAAVKEDLLRVKDVLDLHVRNSDGDVAGLQPQVEALGRVADTLGMLGLGVARNVVQQQREAMQAIVRGDRSADEGALLDVAGALLYVDATLDDQVARLGDSDAGNNQDDLFSNESRKVMEVVSREAVANFADARQAFVAFVETSWDHNELAEVPRLLLEVAGAMTMLELPQPAAYASGVRMYTESELLGRRRVPNGRQLDTLADALASLEYYLEALRENRVNRDDILDIARNSLETLGYWPLPEQAAIASAETAVDDMDAPAADIEDGIAAFIDRSVERPRETPPPAVEVPVTAGTPIAVAAAPIALDAGGFETTGDEIDDEIREVFLEEFGEEIDSLDAQLPAWRMQPDNLEHLRSIRRVFHTLKGSGRLVGARALGEFSWRIENLLNRVLDGRAASPAVVAVVDHAFYALPQLHAALRGEASARVDLLALQTLADRIADGEDVFVSALPMLDAGDGNESVDAATDDDVSADTELAADETDAAADSAQSADPEEAMQADVVAPAADSVPASVDELLLEILDAEVAGHLVTVDDWLALARLAPTRASDALLRAVHTMNGAFAMTEVPLVNDALGPAEAWLRRLFASQGDASDEGVATLGELVDLVRATITALHAPSPRVPACAALAARLIALRDALPDNAVSNMAAHEDDEDGVEPIDADVDRHDVDLHDVALTDLDLSDYADLAAGPEAIVPLADPAETVDAHSPAPETSADDSTVDVHDTVSGDAFAPVVAEIMQVSNASNPANGLGESGDRLDVVGEAEAIDATVFSEQAPEDTAQPDEVRSEEEHTGEERTEEEPAPGNAALDTAETGEEFSPAESPDSDALGAQRANVDRIEVAQLEAERIAAEEELEYAQLEAEYAEADRLAREQAQVAERLETERAAAASAEAERIEAERIEAERVEAERVETERVETERVETERVETERVETERVETERIEAERIEAERIEAERIEAERIEAERIEAERIEAERVEAERAEAERVETARQEAERLEAARLETEAVAESDAFASQPLDAATSTQDIDGTGLEPASEASSGPELATPSDSASEDPDTAFDLTGLDPELVDIFLEEAGDLLDHSDGLLARLRMAPAEREPLVGLQRDLHTIKGGARMAGIIAVGELGHAMETLLEAVVGQHVELDSDGIPLLERGFDRLHAMVTRVGARRAIGEADELIAAFNARAGGRSGSEHRDAAPADAGDAVATRVPAPKVADLKPLSSPIGDAIAEDDDTGVRAPQEQVRIRADLLDRLVNYAGEVAIYRARLEQQVGAFRTAMGEMGQTNTRLRDQLRRLDIETEAQIIARYQREGDHNDATFDPLELDRFSTLQQLSRALGESAADLGSLEGTLDELTRQYEILLLQQSRVSSELQEGLMRTRMVPFDALVPRLRRVVRQAAGETGKQVQLKLDGAQGELDRNVLERMTAPLEHMLRNAVAHGLELPEQRLAANKPEEGMVRIAVRREGSEVVLEVGDDGRGLDRAAIRRRGEERGLIVPDAVLSDGDLDSLIFEPGFSTADEVSRLAGRGVGMDVVASEVRQLGGTLDIASRKGQGATFTLRLPQTLAVTQAVFVKIGETSFAVPIASVRGVGRIARAEFERADALYAYGGEDYPVHDLGGLVGHAAARADGQLQMPLLLIRSGDLRAAVAVDQILGNREIVVKPAGPQLASVPGIFGATIMGDGGVVVILDIAPLVRRQVVQTRVVDPVDAVEQRRVPLVMVVDDSVTMRKVTGRVLERHNFEVASARDGIDALERMADRVPDLMLLDIEMPRMDGYELATQMKADPRLRDVPIIMITSRTGEKHRQRAFEIGVERYLGKPYQENELIRNVYDLLKLQQRGDG